MAQLETLLGAAIGPRAPRRGDQLAQILPARSRAQGTTQIRALLGVETTIPDAVRGEAAPIAARTEGRRGRRDDAEDRAVAEPIALGRCAAVVPDGRDGPV